MISRISITMIVSIGIRRSLCMSVIMMIGPCLSIITSSSISLRVSKCLSIMLYPSL